MHNLLATVDLGSNSFRLLVAKVNSDGSISPIDQLKETVRLANGLDSNNNLTKEAQMIALEALSRFSERLVGFKREQVRVVATSTLRVANNSPEFIAVANKTLGFPLEIISGNEEARLIYLGAIHSLSFSTEKRLIIDIGGGSTEFILGLGSQPQVLESVTMGCVSYSTRFFHHGAFSMSNFEKAILTARSKIQAMEYLFVNQEWQLAVGTSGTAKALHELCIANQLSSEITLNSLLELQKLLIKAENIKDLKLAGLKEDRKPVVAGGLSIMIAIFLELNIKNMVIADGSLREGVMYDLIGRQTDSDLREITINRLVELYELDVKQGNHVAKLALSLFAKLYQCDKDDHEHLKLLEWACQTYEIGLVISHNDYHKHGSYIIQNSDLAGFSKPEQGFMADLIRGHRGTVAKLIEKFNKLYINKSRQRFMLALIVFRLSVIFNRSRQKLDFTKIVDINEVDKNKFNVQVNGEWLANNPLTLFSLTEELNQWNNLGYEIKLIRQAVKH